MFSWQRWIYLVMVAFVEATPLALILTLADRGGWGLLVLVVLLGGVAGWASDRWVPEARERYVILGGGVLVGLWAAKAQAGAGYGLLSGWGQVIGALLDFGAAGSLWPYLTFLIALYLFWRGTTIDERDSHGLSLLFWRLLVLMLMLIAGGALFGALRNVGGWATLQVMVFFSAGLVSIALGRGESEPGQHLRRIGWRGMLTMLGAVAIVLVLGLLLASLFGEQTAALLRGIIAFVAFAFTLILSPLLYLLAGLIEWIVSKARFDALAQALQQQQQAIQRLQEQSNNQMVGLPPWLSVTLRVLCAVVPVLLIVALLVFARRRRHDDHPAEERESLWSWSGVAADLRDLLNGLRKSAAGDGGLAEALARLRGSDPVSRVRRSYIRLLLAGEEREFPRTPPQTPREYEPAAAAGVPAAAGPIGELTERYERARYHPDSLNQADADAAEREWRAIDEARRAQDRKRG